MKTAKLLFTGAATVLLTGSAAVTQNMNDQGALPARVAQQNVPTEGTTPSMRSGGQEAPADQRGPGGFSPQESSPANGGINMPSTTGQGSAAGATKLSTEQRSKIAAIFREHKVRPVQLDIPVHVGARVPPDVHYYPVPTDVADVYPQWRGYDYIMAGDEILIIDPHAHEIVAILVA